KKPESQLLTKEAGENPSPPQSTTPVPVAPKSLSRPVPLAPKRYKLQVTIGEDTRGKLEELQALLSHQIPDGDPAKILDRALDVLLAETKKKKAALTDKPRASRTRSGGKTRKVPARVRREVFKRDEGRCAFVDAEGRRCGSAWQVEFHHRNPYGRGGTHDVENIELRCRGHNQYEAELEFGAGFMAGRRAS
ncbi:MAG: HNH endonuclease, partial [Deltaproteobacteria bacterium]|nr:HNH endonuclease [Deltaproteobacteria bacterium]